jgi:hypothetical protein
MTFSLLQRSIKPLALLSHLSLKPYLNEHVVEPYVPLHNPLLVAVVHQLNMFKRDARLRSAVLPRMLL